MLNFKGGGNHSIVDYFLEINVPVHALIFESVISCDPKLLEDGFKCLRNQFWHLQLLLVLKIQNSSANRNLINKY